jgi:hypothetical protein
MNRRQFLKAAGLAAGAGILPACSSQPKPATTRASTTQPSEAPTVYFIYSPANPVVSSPSFQWAIEHTRLQFIARGLRCINVENGVAQQNVVQLSTTSKPHVDTTPGLPLSEPQSLSISPIPTGIAISGADARGLVYGLLEIADSVKYASHPLDVLNLRTDVVEQPTNRVRSVMRMFSSEVEDKPWFNSPGFWEEYLTMLAVERFNRFNLTFGLGYDFPRKLLDTYFYFAYPFLVDVPGYDVRVKELPDQERDANLRMLKYITSQAAQRGLEFQLGIWTHAYQWEESPNVNYTITGLTPDKHAAYCRDALTMILTDCPDITGVTIRIHGESGVAEGSYDFWRTVFQGAANSGRKIEIDMHAKGMDQPTIDAAASSGLPLRISPKYWAEHFGLPYHQAAIRPEEVPIPGKRGAGAFAQSSGSRSFLRYGYGDLLKQDRNYKILYRIWPGTQRLLLSGDPQTCKAHSRALTFGRSDGFEWCEPLSFKGRKGSGLPGGRNAYAQDSLKPLGGDYTKYSYTYRLWGRLGFNPDTQSDVWHRLLSNDYGSAAQPIERALGQASGILPLVLTSHCPSAANNNYWPEMYFNQPIVDENRPNPYSDTLKPKIFSNAPTLDPQIFSRMDEFAEQATQRTADGRYSPAEVAERLEKLAQSAETELAGVSATSEDNPFLSRAVADVKIQIALGRFFASKFRAGVFYAIYLKTGSSDVLEWAHESYQKARQSYADAADAAKGIYVHDVTFGIDYFGRGNWDDRLAAIDADIQDMEKLRATAAIQAAGGPGKSIRDTIDVVNNPRPRPPLAFNHTPPNAFIPAEPISLQLSVAETAPELKAVLFYRRVNQADTWQSAKMDLDAGTHHATIPPDYTQSPYAIQYYFQVRDTTHAWLLPGFNSDWSNQPYFVVPQQSA